MHSVKCSSEQPLEDSLLELLQPVSGKLPWCNTIKFSLDASLIQHLVIPWQDGISTPGELRNYSAMLAQKHFPQLAGKSFKIGFEYSGYGHNALALALEEEQWRILHQVTQRLKIRFLGVITPLRSLLETWQHALPDEGIFALIGEESSTFACRSEGQWQQIHRMALPDLHTRQQLALVARLTGMRDASCHIWDKVQGRITL
ncbi:hypothetical protein EXT68_02835 [Pectobacterium parmentieri]|nr:hypothetical protein [Pectobacterium parmentieri]MBI0472078.1 hypothetical protein [Pectobacterium parmentieri]MBI0495187.1 hypothetical protein [Pectobacterium parmentieri]MBI0556239.1 hypothetical protein [Pectobacterium parmentieri]MBI0569323.1 hypothetical protein [Pectobacterium parmentieri]MBI0573925.1 hypothetical protein [Pectobacterium parmentieri]